MRGYTPAGKVKRNLRQPLLCLGNQYGVAGSGRRAPRRRWDDSFLLEAFFIIISLLPSFSSNASDDDDNECVCIGAGARNGITLFFDMIVQLKVLLLPLL